MRTTAVLAIVLVVFAAAIIAGIAPYCYTAALEKTKEQQDMKQKPLADQISTQIASQTISPTVEIQLHASQKGTVLQPFLPSVVNIHAGDTVTWVNHDTTKHTVSSALFDSGPIAPQNSTGSQEKSIFRYKFDQKGIYVYFDKIYPHMGGVVYVDSEETQREIIDTTNSSIFNVKVEMPQNAAYQNKFGPYFIPANAIVPSGSRVTWVNHDFIAHTATAGDGTTFDTEQIIPSQSKSLIINGTGRIAYYCEIHPWMQGSLTIVDPDR
jgi:plastocyanin